MDFFPGPKAPIDHSLDIQLNVDGSAERLAQLAYHWIDHLLTEVAGDARAQLAGLPALPSAAMKALGVGDLFGLVTVTRPNPAGGMAREKTRTLSVKGLQWLRSELADTPPNWVRLETGRIDEFGGLVGGDFSASIQTYDESPGWMQLQAAVRASRFTDPAQGSQAQRRWLDAVRAYAEHANPGFGQVGYHYYAGKTVLEQHTDHRVAGLRRVEPRYAIGSCRDWLRGYSWLTLVPGDLTEKVGGSGGLGATGAFVEVAQLGDGGMWLLATNDFRDYLPEKAAEVFHALAPILPPGMPVQAAPSLVAPPALLVYEDPSVSR
ncbi:hypothetical protein [Actinoplanes regularis]|uniref:Uncharacterized protein n=1 Tax=Actinoplanes regularis TaxID=52697 RepID=A0A238V185_9ACTN|nr:hypothetical protein [Actinoplanes regularis]GIE84072.1 hypothetical protein Are01nite_05520 [Actinoplanes regularis]SNR28185.1 hypothetical protein SAMN06264365_101516 [Actinoplanes regularis]